jgi:hypothetical protein
MRCDVSNSELLHQNGADVLIIQCPGYRSADSMRRGQKKSSNWLRIATSIHHTSIMSHEQTDRQLNRSRAYLLPHTAAWDRHFYIRYMPLQNEKGSVTTDNHLVAHEKNSANSQTKPDSRDVFVPRVTFILYIWAVHSRCVHIINI